MADEADMLRADVRAAREQIARREQRIALAEREVDFLQALLVCLPNVIIFNLQVY